MQMVYLGITNKNVSGRTSRRAINDFRPPDVWICSGERISPDCRFTKLFRGGFVSDTFPMETESTQPYVIVDVCEVCCRSWSYLQTGDLRP